MAYENAGLFDKAGEVIRTLLIENPFDVELMLRLGLFEEKRGNFEEAGKACARALDMMLTRLPRRAAANGASRNERAFNVTDLDQFGDLAIRSLIASVRTPEDCQRLLASCREKVRAEVANLETHDDFATGIGENPRLKSFGKRDAPPRTCLSIARTTWTRWTPNFFAAIPETRDCEA